jgi:hypothetical protein
VFARLLLVIASKVLCAITVYYELGSAHNQTFYPDLKIRLDVKYTLSGCAQNTIF